jgi:hypothetical protein
MSILCSVMGHTAATTRHSNGGVDFAMCHHCGRDLIRFEQAGEWSLVPKGYRVVWRDLGRAGNAASVANRMERLAPPPRRRDPRSARPKPRRDPRGRPFGGSGSVLGVFAHLNSLVAIEDDGDAAAFETKRQDVIRLPGAAN